MRNAILAVLLVGCLDSERPERETPALYICDSVEEIKSTVTGVSTTHRETDSEVCTDIDAEDAVCGGRPRCRAWCSYVSDTCE